MTDWTTAIEFRRNQTQVFTEERFRDVFKYQEQEKQTKAEILRQKLKCSKNFIFKLFPFLEWIPKYDFKNEILNDVVIAIVMTPILVQIEVALADVSGLPMVVGLYASIFPSIIYFFLGTSRHIAIGLSATISMMVGNAVTKYANNRELFDHDYSPLQIAIALSFLSGCWLLIFAFLRLGSICSFLSESFTNAFYIVACFHIIPGRIKSLLGIDYPEPPSLFSIFYHCYEIFKRVPDTNLVTLGLSVLFAISLIIFNVYGKPAIIKKFPHSKVSSTFSLLLIVLSTVLAYTLDLHNNYNVEIVGYFPNGLPEIVIPPFEILPKLMFDSFILSVVVIPLYLPLTKMLAKENDYKIRSNQELLAYGVINITCSFFSCPLTGNSLSRSLIQDGLGGGSPFSNLITVIFLILILLFVGPIIKYIPVCVLSVIILDSMKRPLMRITQFPEMYRKSKIDAAVWLITLFTSLIAAMDYGTLIGMAACAVATFIPSQKTKVIVLGHVPGTQTFLDQNHFKSAVTMDGILILKIIGNIHFANSENVQDKILEQVRNYKIRSIVLNLACVGYIDLSGVKSLSLVLNDLKKRENSPKLFLTDCLPDIYKKLSDCDFFKVFPKDHVFASVNDAIDFLRFNGETSDVYITKF